MNEDTERQEGLRERLSARGEEAIGEVADALLENPYFNQALQAAFGARDRALGAQRAAMDALNLPSADEIDRLNRRVRSLSERLERIEDAIDRLEERLPADQS
jgi:chromosome segregation ATPase